MNARDVIQLLNEQDIINLMLELGSEYPLKVNNGLAFSTVCHCGHRKKLIWFRDTKLFHCYTDCGCSYSLFNLVGKVLGLDFASSFKYVCNKFNINYKTGFEFSEDKVDISFIKKFSKKEEDKLKLNIYDTNVLENFEKMYHISWLKDNIKIEVMREFGIRYDILENRIIIPHFDYKNNLIGIRCRNLTQSKIDEGKKYMPISFNKQLYNYPTSLNLYGLNMNKDYIKHYKKVIIVESEKAVMQHKSYFDESICVAIAGSSISKQQIELLQKFEVETVILALDKEYQDCNTQEEEIYRVKIQKAFIDKLEPYFHVEVIWDVDNLLERKMSPLDIGADVFTKLYETRIKI